MEPRKQEQTALGEFPEQSPSSAAFAVLRGCGDHGAAGAMVQSLIRTWHTPSVRRLRELQGWDLDATDPFPTANEVATIASQKTIWSLATCRKRVHEIARKVGKRVCAVTGHRVAIFQAWPEESAERREEDET